MKQLFFVASLALLCNACGGGIDSYSEGARAQADIMREMIEVLEDVDDEDSAEDAAGEIEALGVRLREISIQVSELPRPSAEEMQAIIREQSESQREIQLKTAEQMMKLAQYESLTNAWTRAMSNMR